MIGRGPARVRALLALAVLTASCGPPPPPTYPGELLSVDALGPDRLLRQRIHGWHGDTEWETEVVLQKQGDRLLLLALTPFGTRMFAIEQRGANEVEVTTFVDAPMPFPPRFVLLDVHRALFMGIGGAPPSDGRREATRAGERIVELWQGRALRERTFERLDGDPRGHIRVVYVDGMRDGVVPRIIRLDNPWLGYRLEIETLTALAL